MEIIIDNIRTLRGRHEIPIRPITILTGENSSGKTTFLASLAAITTPVGFPLEPAFNRAPYNLGNYDTIASKFGKAESFSLGWREGQKGSKNERWEIGTYRSAGSGFQLTRYSFKTKEGEIEIEFNEDTQMYDVQIKVPASPRKKTFKFNAANFVQADFLGGFAGRVAYQLLSQRPGENWSDLYGLVRARTLDETVSIAPIRTRPERTYDRTSELTTPEGGHIPFILDRILNENSSARQRTLLSALRRFGKESGLFKYIKVRKLGDKASDPFQVQANVSGRATNLTDVGYGVSQSLPVLIESVLASSRKKILIQQPEVHLHPKAQAALGSFFVELAGSDHKEFVIETHSDFILDRIRQEVAKGSISPESVVFLYFERRRTETIIHSLTLDSDGNILNAPECYRSFFLREEFNLLNRTSK